MAQEMRCVLAVDPGTMKCGLAVVRRTDGGGSPEQTGFEVLHKSVLERAEFPRVLKDLLEGHSPGAILIGDGTASEEYTRLASGLGVPVQVVKEEYSTLRGRRRYFLEHPPRGLWRLVPTSLQTPSRPYDDYVAVVLAEMFLSSQS